MRSSTAFATASPRGCPTTVVRAPTVIVGTDPCMFRPLPVTGGTCNDVDVAVVVSFAGNLGRYDKTWGGQ